MRYRIRYVDGASRTGEISLDLDFPIENVVSMEKACKTVEKETEIERVNILTATPINNDSTLSLPQ